MTEEHLLNLETLNDYEEIFQFTKNIIKTDCEFDGLTIVVHQKDEEKYILLTEDLQWRDMPSLPESLIKSTFETKTPQVISEASEKSLFNQNIDCFEEEKVSALLLYPFENADENLDIVISLWKRFKKEKEEVMEPLIVGSQRVGVTTRVKSTLIPTTFKAENLSFLSKIEESLRAAVSKLMAQIEAQKNAVLKQISNDEQVFNTPQEIIATLVNILMGTNTSIQNLKDTVKQIKEQIHHNDKIMPQVIFMQKILDTLNQNLMNTFQFSTTNNVIQELFKGKEVVETKEFFEYFGTFGQDIICKKGLFLNFFLDPRLHSRIKVERQNTYIFLTELLRFSFDDAKKYTHFNIHISEDQQNASSLFKITYRTEIEDPQSYRNMFINNQSDNVLSQSIHLSYKKFVQTGGKISIGADAEKQKVVFNITIPFENNTSAPLANAIAGNDVKIGLLLDKEEDFHSANNIARYMLALGIEKTQVRGAENIKLFNDDLTHLIVFQSKFSKELFESTLKNKPYHIMIITNGCPKEESVTFFDYSMVDYEVDRNRFYLYDLEDFLQMETE